MHNLKRTLLILLFTLSAPSFSHENGAFRVVQDWFAATSAFDDKGLKAAITDDFQLLENGHLWDSKMLLDAIMSGKGKFKRRNFFKVLKQQTKGDMMWISYWNKAIFSSTAPTNKQNANEIFWLESIVLVKVKGLWKIQMLHSSRVKADKMPKDVSFEEYVK